MTDTIETDLHCPECGYNLREIDSRRCPECGVEIDRTILGESFIPWLHRSKIGRYRAFCRTVHAVTFRTKRLKNEMNLPARFGDAVRFRRLVVVHAMVTLGLAFSISYYIGLSNGRWGFWVAEDPWGSMFEALAIPAGWFCLAFFLFATTGVASYFFHPRSLPVVRQNRAVALSYYACAPLAYLPITASSVVAASFAIMMFNLPRYSIAAALVVFLIGYVPIGAQAIALVVVPVRLLRLVTHGGVERQIALAIFLPIAWGILAVLLLVVVPAGLTIMALMILSFRS